MRTKATEGPVVVEPLKELQLEAVKDVDSGAAAAGVTADAISTRPIDVPMTLNLLIPVRMVGTSSQSGVDGGWSLSAAARHSTHHLYQKMTAATPITSETVLPRTSLCPKLCGLERTRWQNSHLRPGCPLRHQSG
jgi:hypothetical protein